MIAAAAAPHDSPFRVRADGSPLDPMRLALVVNEIARAIGGTLDLDELVQVTVLKTRELLEAEGASVLLIDEQTGELYFDTVAGADGEIMSRIRLRKGEGIAGQVVASNQPMLVANASHDPRLSRMVDAATAQTTRSLVAAPLVADGRVIGVIEAVNPVSGGAFDERSLEALTWLAPHVALAVRNGRITAELVKSREEVRRNNEALEQRVRQRTAQIARGKAEWERTFDAISEPLFLLDDFSVRRANLAFARMAGIPVQEAIGKTCHRLLAGRDTPCPGCPLAERQGGTGEVTHRGRTLKISSFALQGGGEQVMHYQDVTASRQLEQRLSESQRMASVGQLAAGAAHEINNPLGFLTSNLGTLESYVEDIGRAFTRISAVQGLVLAGEEARALALMRKSDLLPQEAVLALADAPELLQESRVGARRVAEIVKALKELARESSGPRVVDDPRQILERAATRAGVARERLLHDERDQVKISAEPVQMELALANILKNADQAMGGVGTIAIVTSREDDRVTIAIRDTGCGMTPEVRARVFDPFFTTRGIGGGIGLGLTASYGIVTRHGGVIELDSTPGKGTTVRVALPLATNPAFAV